ncbi:hypothetical protein BGZ49_007867 [Haplosporangium sp. Z 27]|nr:hypothetical protein BGZ49_007867 [Haplosporangium sp. Z 27]
MFKDTPHSAFLFLLISFTFTFAQSYQPLATYASSSAYVEGQSMYIVGGIPTALAAATSSPSDFTLQTFILDLSQSWNASEPIYKPLPNGPTESLATAISPNGQSLVTLAHETICQLDIKSSKWINNITTVNYFPYMGIAAITDPKGGLIYVPNGYFATNSAGLSSMLAINATTNAITTIAVDPKLNGTQYYTAAWSVAYNSMFVLTGGTTNYLLSYTPSIGWKELNATGYAPSPRYGACMIPVSGGSSMILFGGLAPQATTALNDIYILDIPTMTWKRGPDADQINARGLTSCSYSNGKFIAVGGVSVSNAVPGAPRDVVLIYDTAKGDWTTTYNAVSNNTTNTTNTTSSTSTGSTSTSLTSTNPTSTNPISTNQTSHTAPIIGGVAGGSVVIISIVVVIFYRRRSRKAEASFFNDNNGNFKYPPPSMDIGSPMSYSTDHLKKEPYNGSFNTSPTPPTPPTSTPAPVYFQSDSDKSFQQPLTHNEIMQTDPTYYPQDLSRNTTKRSDPTYYPEGPPRNTLTRTDSDYHQQNPARYETARTVQEGYVPPPPPQHNPHTSMAFYGKSGHNPHTSMSFSRKGDLTTQHNQHNPHTSMAFSRKGNPIPQHNPHTSMAFTGNGNPSPQYNPHTSMAFSRKGDPAPQHNPHTSMAFSRKVDHFTVSPEDQDYLL